ncbi:hypothetical protein HNY73_017206 [Argiope bruennichi]|uniref:Uncharacterized protein n=1 Tax=Argiope bruennichi TaxID=94029 RepID=A0A8T0ER59_ARGBR|nr:hypothetical protein HNY73_017206 [Argiope bruennichi]
MKSAVFRMHTKANNDLSSLVTFDANLFFVKFSISANFLDKQPAARKDDTFHESGNEKLDKAIIVDAAAERDAELFKIYIYNNIFTKD